MRDRLAVSDGSELRLLGEADADELHRLIQANRAQLAHWMPWAADQTPEAHGSTTIGYWLDEGHQGRGLMTRAVRALVDLAFGELELHRVEIRAATDNRRSRAIPERLGFREEGVQREVERIGTRYNDLVVYGLLAPEWVQEGA